MELVAQKVSRQRYRLIRWADRAARWVITAGGLVVIGSVIGMMVLLLSVVLPLFQGAKATLRAISDIPVPARSGAASGISSDLSSSRGAGADGGAPLLDGSSAAETGGSDVQAPAAIGVELVEMGRSGQEDLLAGYVLSRSGLLIGWEWVRSAQSGPEPSESLEPKIIFQQTLRPSAPSSGGRQESPNRPADSATPSEVGPEKPPPEHPGRSPSPNEKESGTPPAPPEKAGPAPSSPPSGVVEIISAESLQPNQWSLLWSDGSVWLVQIEPEVRFDPLGRRSLQFRCKQLADLPPVSTPTPPVQAQVRAEENGGCVAVLLLADHRILLRRQTIQTDLFGQQGEPTIADSWIDPAELPGPVTALRLNHEGNRLFVGTQNGYVVRFQIEPSGKPARLDAVWTPGREPVTALSLLFGDVSLVVGSAYGSVHLWFPVRKQGPIAPGESPDRLTPIRSFRPQKGEVRTILPSPRNKAFLTLGRQGIIHLDYGTTGRHLLHLEGPTPAKLLAYSSRANAVLALGEDQRLYLWQIQAAHAEVSWSALFGRLWYESHETPKFLWQSSGTEEPKMSLVPLVFGTLKATLYAMLFALPLALGSAVYVSQFTKPAVRRAIKPTVEIMAAIPTVVIGFLILLWAAPVVGRWLLAVLLSLVALPVSFVLWMLLWQVLRRWALLRRVEEGYEFLVILPPLLLGTVAVGLLSGPIEQAWLGGNFRQWLYEQIHLPYDQLNALVVALGLGFAIIPIIFSISEDALSSIPHSLKAASLALGASRWQTLWRVVLPSASPGIFAAVMIGLGRAVGETMIVFMAAGNTPVLDPSPFNGFRTLSANIAVEISEHPRDGTLYRVLFLCATILFFMTFLLNTAAELVRRRLRKQYGQY